ncbi:MAG: DUF1788 domain-containing protein [Thiotrichaceae bacterium]|nr:DUF1788 domain-containing protein [Thiotrichaceae bacterium]
MNQQLQTRLDKIPDKLVSEEFLSSKGIGNEIGFYIFDYPAEQELQVRTYISFLEQLMAKKSANLKLIHINLLDLLLAYLESRKLLDKVIELQKRKGDDALLKALAGPLHIDKVSKYLIDEYSVSEHDMVLISGVGSVWPLLRTHNLLNGLHAKLGHKPLVLFYPGEYTGQDMSLFGKIKSDNYYRAFKLVP